jgi:nicotinate phosphoribosyltransferase
VQAVRLDSGDIGSLAHKARAILDSSNRSQVKILASGDLDEYRIHELVAASAPIDSFGVGTELVTSRDAPALSMVYKLVELDGAGRVKLSPGKKTYPLAKQVHRQRDSSGLFQGDHVTRANETCAGEPLLVPVVLAGKLAQPMPDLESIRARCREQLAALPEGLQSLSGAASYPISYSKVLEDEATRLRVKAQHQVGS